MDKFCRFFLVRIAFFSPNFFAAAILFFALTGTVLCVLLILGVEVVNSIGHDISRVHSFLKRRKKRKRNFNFKEENLVLY